MTDSNPSNLRYFSCTLINVFRISIWDLGTHVVYKTRATCGPIVSHVGPGFVDHQQAFKHTRQSTLRIFKTEIQLS